MQTVAFRHLRTSAAFALVLAGLTGCGNDAPTTPARAPTVAGDEGRPLGNSTAPAPQSSLPSGGTTRAIRGARAAARRFLPGYLRFTYDQGDADAIDQLTPGLRDELARSAPRVPATRRALMAKVTGTQTELVTADRIEFLVAIDDGQTRYGITVAMLLTGDEWLAAAVAPT